MNANNHQPQHDEGPMLHWHNWYWQNVGVVNEMCGALDTLHHFCGGMLREYVSSLMSEDIFRQEAAEDTLGRLSFCRLNADANEKTLREVSEDEILTAHVYHGGAIREPLTAHILLLLECDPPQTIFDSHRRITAMNDRTFAVFVRNDIKVEPIVDDDLEMRFTVARKSSKVQLGVIKPQEVNGDAVVERVRPLFELEEGPVGQPLLFIDPSSLIKDVSCDYFCDRGTTVLAYTSLVVMGIGKQYDEGRGDHLSLLLVPRSSSRC